MRPMGGSSGSTRPAVPLPATPAVAGELVYVGSYDGKFYALDAKSGAARWKFATGGERRFEAKGLHGMRPKNQTIADRLRRLPVEPGRGGRVGVLRQRRRQRLFARCRLRARSTGNSRRATSCTLRPRIADGVVYFGSWDSYFYAVDAAAGAQKWRFHGGEDPLIHNQVGFQSSPAVVNGVVYTGCRDSKLYAIDAATGREKWQFRRQGKLGESARLRSRRAR